MAKKPPTTDPLARSQTRATWIATIAAVAALALSVIALYESREARIASRHDELRIHAYRPALPITVQDGKGPLHYAGVVAQWQVMISNTGTSTVSIVNYDVFELKLDGTEFLYSELDQGVSLPESNQALSLPIHLEAGRSIKLRFSIGLTPGPKAYQTLTAAFEDKPTSVHLREVEETLAKNGIDIYDNPALLFHGMVSIWCGERQCNEQVFVFRFVTARGVLASETTSWYDQHQF